MIQVESCAKAEIIVMFEDILNRIKVCGMFRVKHLFGSFTGSLYSTTKLLPAYFEGIARALCQAAVIWRFIRFHVSNLHILIKAVKA
ncbi:hypothetical protein TcasGA2_TC002854 [Tribolium castaneum]|uniref:Uncharacterized protein n=1 Tax=Tribolium castaneum TaxID=7070 RepID=D6WHW7_TRICA|nr:hypothetical protein TcasGA2_TC002854 [Tribolium castaneum]